MATIFEQIESTLSSGDLPDKLGAQVGGLGQIGTTVAGLIEHPPQGIDDLLGSVRSLPLPDVNLGSDLPGTLQSLQQAVPADLTSVLGGITGNLGDLSGLVTGDLSTALNAGLGPVLALRKLLELDLTCFQDDPSAPPPPPPPPGTPPSGTQRTAAALDQAHSALSALPASFATEDVLHLLAGGGDLQPFMNLPIPVFDDLRDGVATLLDWNAKTGAQIVSALGDTLQALKDFITASVDAAFGTLAADAQTLTTALGPLPAIADTLVTCLADVPAHVAEINAACDQLATFQLDPTLKTRLIALPGELHDQVGHIEAALAPPGNVPINFPGDEPIAPEVGQAIDGVLSPAIGWLQDIAAKLDLSFLAGPIHTAADKVDDAVAEVEQGLAAVTTQVQQLFGQVEGLLDNLDTAAITDALKQALDQFGTAVTNQLTSLFAPIKQILEDAISELDSAVGAFNPQSIVGALNDLIDGLAGVLDDPAIKSAREQIAGAFTTAEQQLGALSFSPVTDEVTGAIDTITKALKALDPSTLSAPAQLALQGAVALLPGDLDPLTHPLLDDFQTLVDEGPGALVDQVRAPVAQLQDQVRHFEPAALVGDQLDKPFKDALAKLEAFKPSDLLKPVEQELAKLKQRLAKEIGPQKLLQPLQAPFDELLHAFDQLKPDQLVKPLEDAIHDVVNTILDALPIDEILGPVGKVLDAVQGVADVLHKGKDVLDQIAGVLEKLDPEAIEPWVDSVLAKIGDASSLQPQLDAIQQALEATTAAKLGQRASTAALLAALDAADRLTAIATAHRAVDRSALPAAAQQALDRADPFALPYNAISTFRRDAHTAADALAAELATWDARYHALTTPMQASGIAQWLKDAAEPQVIKPLRALLAPAGPLHTALAPALTQLEALLTDLEGKVATFGTGPGSAGSIKTAIDALVDRLRNLDLGFLKEGLAGVFANVRGKLTAIGPDALAPLFQQAFDEALAGLDLSSVLPQTDIDKLDADFEKVVDALEQLDPSKLIVDAVQPVYDEKVAPLIDAFDLSGVLDKLLTALHGLKDELDEELEKVNQSYQAMLGSVPPLNPLSIAGDLGDVAGDIGGLF